MQLSYQEFNYFMDRYKQVVFGYVTDNLYTYTDKLNIKPGPYKDMTHYELNMETNTMELVHEKIGPSVYDNLNKLIAGTVDINFYNIIKKYAVTDCDFQYCHDCADEITVLLKEYWHLY